MSIWRPPTCCVFCRVTWRRTGCRGGGVLVSDLIGEQFGAEQPSQRTDDTVQGHPLALDLGQFAAEHDGGDHRRYRHATDRARGIPAERRQADARRRRHRHPVRRRRNLRLRRLQGAGDHRDRHDHRRRKPSHVGCPQPPERTGAVFYTGFSAAPRAKGSIAGEICRPPIRRAPPRFRSVYGIRRVRAAPRAACAGRRAPAGRPCPPALPAAAARPALPPRARRYRRQDRQKGRQQDRPHGLRGRTARCAARAQL